VFEDFSSLRAFLPVAVFLAMAAVESVRPGVALVGELGTRWASNVGVHAINTGLGIGLGALGVSAFSEQVAALSLGLFPALTWWLPGWGQVVAAVLLLDFYNYLVHRMLHRFSWLWPLHGVHHADVDLDVTTGFRHHPGEAVLMTLLGIGFAMLAGVPLLVWSVYATVTNMAVLMQHANIRLPQEWERVLTWVLVTPGMHRHHHAVDRAIHDTNYGALFSIWDRLFGTYRATSPDIRDAQPIGLAGLREIRDQRLDGVLVMPARIARRLGTGPMVDQP
jgi:sterol desaturase/sphingolipid hydroxylase (fatty acid hydroxylase superfamily)